MNTNQQTAIKEKQNESKMKIISPNLIRWAGLAAVLAGIFYVAVGLFHPLNVLASVTTARWAIVHVLATAMCVFGLFGLTGLYARQAKEAGWLGLLDDAPVGDYTYRKDGRDRCVLVFVMTVTDERDHWPESAFRCREWLTVEDAVARIEEPGLRQIVLALPLAVTSRP